MLLMLLAKVYFCGGFHILVLDSVLIMAGAWIGFNAKLMSLYFHLFGVCAHYIYGSILKGGAVKYILHSE